MRKNIMREHRRRMKQFPALHCQRVTAEDVLYRATASPCGFTAKAAAFHQWKVAAVRSKPDDGPRCLTCNVEFGPGRAVPAAFWFQSPFTKQSKVPGISGVCSACFGRKDCMDRILAGIRDLQVMPMTAQ